MDPKPRELLLDGLAQVVERIPWAGLRLVKSGPVLRRSSPDPSFSNAVSFRGHKWNAAGVSAEYQMVAFLEANGLAKWRAAQQFTLGISRENVSDFLAAKSFENPACPDEIYGWQMGPLAPDPSLIESMAEVISGQILAWFSVCQEPERFSETGLPWHFAHRFIEFALMQQKPAIASALARLAICLRQDQFREWSEKTGELSQRPSIVDLSLEDLCKWSNPDRNLLGLIRMHGLEAEWVEP